jgi:hypothetical protein
METVLACVQTFLMAPANWEASDDALLVWRALLFHIRLARRQPVVVELRIDRTLSRIEICLSHRHVERLQEAGRNYLNDLRGMVHVYGGLPMPAVDPWFDLNGQVDTDYVNVVVDVIHGPWRN